VGFRQSRRTRQLTKATCSHRSDLDAKQSRSAVKTDQHYWSRGVIVEKRGSFALRTPCAARCCSPPSQSYISFITFPAISHLPTPLKRVHWRVDPPLLRSDVVRCRGSASQTSQLPCPIPGRPGRSQREQISSMHAHSILVTLKFVIQASAQKYQQGYRGGAHDERTSPTQSLHAT